MKMSKKKAALFWITGLSGSGKTTLANKITPYIKSKYSTVITLSGDDIRKKFNFNKFDKSSRVKYALFYSKLCKKFVDNGITVIFSTVSMFDKVRKWNRKNIKKYVEIYIESDIEILVKKKKKFFYKKKLSNIVGKNIKAELPKNPHILIKNNFENSINFYKKELLKKLKKT